jgi:hypothetical protein
VRDVVRDRFHDFSADLEGRELTFMYLDSAEPLGLVTTATGCLIDPLSMAIGLPWMRPDGTPASPPEVTACWLLVKGREDLKKHGGGIYAGLAGNTLRLTPEGARNLVNKRLTWFDLELAKLFPAWDDWPAMAQLFGLSWAWAVGAAAKYPRMIARLRDGDFAGAALECTINPQRGTIVTRNKRNRILLSNAARTRDLHLDPDVIDWETDWEEVARALQNRTPTLPDLGAITAEYDAEPVVHIEEVSGDYLSPDEPDDAA